LLSQDFFHQIVQHEMVAAGEGLDEAGGVLMSLHRERGQLQAGDPAFGAGFQGRDVFGREVEAHDLVEEIGSFGGGETQVGRTQLGHLPPAAQAGQWELRVLTGGDDQVHLGRLVFKQKGQNCGDRCRCVNRSLCIDRSGIDQVVVVKDEDELPARGRDLVQERGQECFGARRLGGLERSQHLCSDAGEEGLQRRDEVGQKARGRAVRCVQRKPGDANPSFARLATGEPFADQRGLAEAGGGRDEGQFVAGRETLVQPLDQPGARDHLGSRWGDIEFGGQDGRRHGSIIQRASGLRKASRAIEGDGSREGAKRGSLGSILNGRSPRLGVVLVGGSEGDGWGGAERQGAVAVHGTGNVGSSVCRQETIPF